MTVIAPASDRDHTADDHQAGSGAPTPRQASNGSKKLQ